jgi:hypothetical protein
VLLWIAAIFRAATGQQTAEPLSHGVIEGDDAIVEQVCRNDRCLAVIALPKRSLQVSMKVCWQWRPTPFMLPT